MKKTKIIYWLMNDLLQYLLRYSALETFTEADAEQALADSDRICERYRNAPSGIGYLARKMCIAINSYFIELDRRRNHAGKG